MLDRFLEWVAQLPELLVYVVLMALSAIENVFPPAPADIAVVLGAFLAQQGLMSAPVLGVLCWLSNTASSTLPPCRIEAKAPDRRRARQNALKVMP